MKKKIMTILPYVLLALALLVFVYWAGLTNLLGNVTAVSNSKYAEGNCVNLSSRDTVDCVVSYVKTFYIYNTTDDSRSLSFDELKSRGGDCKDWTEFYISELSKYGFSGHPDIIFLSKSGSVNLLHEHAIVYRDSVYCDIDGVDYLCRSLI